MKVSVFISWSGEYSRQVAKHLHSWLNRSLIFTKPFYSADDIVKGTRWSSDISRQLEQSNIGLLIITPENCNNNWILFEAGALSRKIDQSRVCPILFDLAPSDLKGPLTQFQLALFTKEDMLKVFTMINSEAGEFSLDSERMREIFDQWWPTLERDIAAIPKNMNRLNPEQKPDDVSSEILEKLRGIELVNNYFSNYVSKEEKIIDNLIDVYEKLAFRVHAMPGDNHYDLEITLLELLNPVNAFLTLQQRTPFSNEQHVHYLHQKLKAAKKVVFKMNLIDDQEPS